MRAGPALQALSGAAAAWLLALLVLHSDAGVGIAGFLFAAYGGAALALAAAALFVFSPAARRAGRRRQLALPACLLAGAALVMFGAPPANPLFRLRFALSESALADAARRAAARPGAVAPGWIGLFAVGAIDSLDRGEVRFITTGCGVVDRCGFVHAPTQPPRRVAEDRFTPLGGGWYHLHEGF